MKNALAVYTSNSSLNGRKLVDLAREYGIQIRFMAMGAFIPGNPAEIQSKALTTVNGGGLLIVGGFKADEAAIAEFDKLVGLNDRSPIADMLNGGKLPWCELHTTRFDYEKTVKANAKDKPRIDGSVPKAQLSVFKVAKTRYIIHNQSRKKNCRQLMIGLTEAIATHTDGVVADYVRPSR